MKAITVKYLPATDHKPCRLVASTSDQRMVVSREVCDTPREAAEALCEKMGWAGEMVQGSWKKYEVFVFLD